MLKESNEAIARAKTWLEEAAAPGSLFEKQGLTYRGLFKAPLGFQSVGLFQEAIHSLQILKEQFMKPNGDFCDPSDVGPDVHPAPSLEFFYPYRTSWIVIGAQRLGRYDVSLLTGDFILSMQDKYSGGFVTTSPDLTRDDSNRYFNICGTAQAVLAALALGQWRVAKKGADFLANVFKIQSEQLINTQRLYTTVDERGEVITDWPPEDSGYCYIELDQPNQNSYVSGLAAGVLAMSYRLFERERYLQAAVAYHNFTAECRDAFTNPACGKLMWSGALLYNITGESEYMQHCEKAAESLCNIINTEPPIHVSELYPDYNNQPVPFTFEVAFEYVHWLTEAVKELQPVQEKVA